MLEAPRPADAQRLRGSDELARSGMRQDLVRAEAPRGHRPAFAAGQRHDSGGRADASRERERPARDEHLVVGMGHDRHERPARSIGKRGHDRGIVAAMPKRRPSVVTVYHRAPYGEDAHGAMTPQREHSSPNGIIPTLRDAFDERASGVWVAWTSANAALRPGFAHDVTVEHDGSQIDVHRVALSASAVDSFYHRFSKEALWPIICSFPASARFDERLWINFVDVNTRFADAVSRIAAPDSRILVHDYNLWLVPGLLRSRMPGARIGFFHHTPFPAADIFAILPWRDEILASLLACDLVGFHLPHYANNFATAAANLAGASIERQEPVPARMSAPGTPLSAPRIVRELGLGDRRIRLGAFPAAIDSARIDAIRATPAHARRVAAIRQELDGRRALLSLERLDYVKGPVEKLLAFERFLESRAGSGEEITLVSVLAPAAQAVSVHVATRAQVDECVDANQRAIRKRRLDAGAPDLRVAVLRGGRELVRGGRRRVDHPAARRAQPRGEGVRRSQ